MLNSVELTNFRTHQKTKVLFDSPLTFIIGQNASGKTNLLEALYVNSLTKSYRSPLRDTVAQGQDFYKIITKHSNDKEYMVEQRLQKTPKGTKKAFLVNDVKKRQKDIVGLWPVVLFEPTDLEIITAGPERRRSFLDVLLSQADQEYLQNLSLYKRLLQQRNQMLKFINQGKNKAEDLFVYNLQMVEPIYYISSAREKFLDSIKANLTKTYQSISNSRNKVYLSYVASIPAKKDLVLKELEKVLEKDLLRGYSVRGPHRDNIIITLDKDLPPESLSRGEIRTLSLALKIAEFEYLTQTSHHPPLLLLDDVMSELDVDRQSKLWQATNAHQVIITTTHLEKDLKLPKHQIITLGK